MSREAKGTLVPNPGLGFRFALTLATAGFTTGFRPYGSSANGDTAGPFSAVPSTAKWDPWQGQSQQRSREFQWTWHPTWVHDAERL